MDALPVTEAVDLPFASKVKAQYDGKEVGVMHACGHDSHIAILMGTATVLTKMKNEVPGTVVFIFQRAEEGRAGAKQMIDDGLFEKFPVMRFSACIIFPIFRLGISRSKQGR